jgi:hypothetical protein
MSKAIGLSLALLCNLICSAQVPFTRASIQRFVDSVGETRDFQVIETSIYPAEMVGSSAPFEQKVTIDPENGTMTQSGTKFKSKIKIWDNSKKNLLWAESIIRDSMSTAFFFCKDSLIFVGELTYVPDSTTGRRKPIFRNIYFSNSKIIDDTAPGRNNNSAKHYLDESQVFVELHKVAQQ